MNRRLKSPGGAVTKSGWFNPDATRLVATPVTGCPVTLERSITGKTHRRRKRDALCCTEIVLEMATQYDKFAVHRPVAVAENRSGRPTKATDIGRGSTRRPKWWC